jgi:hypothetical protein
MRYTAVFKWPEGQEPRVGKGDGWKGGELCAVSFNDALDELQRLREAAQHYCDNYLRDEFDEPELCYDDRHRAAVVALWDALETTPNDEQARIEEVGETQNGKKPRRTGNARTVRSQALRPRRVANVVCESRQAD